MGSQALGQGRAEGFRAVGGRIDDEVVALASDPIALRSSVRERSRFFTDTVDCGKYKVHVEVVTRSDVHCPTILFVNGALTTTSSLRWAIKNLVDFNIVGFDFPVFGSSFSLNPHAALITKEQEVEIVTRLCNLYEPEFLFSFSWGGTSALLSLTEKPESVRKAIISSYSVGLTKEMRAMAEDLVYLIDAGDYDSAALVTIDNLGEFLPDKVKRLFRGYFVTLSPQQVQNVVGQIRYMLALAAEDELAKLRKIKVPVLFGNGSRDRLTSAGSIRPIEAYISNCEFAVIEGSGHFMALEGKQVCDAACARIRSFFRS